MPPIVLKIEGNESFLPFSNLDQDELSKTWRVCTKVKDSLENGSRLENLSWRLWFIQNVLVSNDVKSKSKFQSWSSKTTRKMETEKPLESTSTLYPSNSNPGNNTSYTTKIQKPQPLEDPRSVLDYSLDEIKPLGTENFVLHQFTSDQQDDQIIELKDIFPFGMGDFMDLVPATQNHTSAPEIETYNHAPQSWPPAPEQNTTYYNRNNNMASLESNMQYLPTVNPLNPQYISQNNNVKQNNGIFSQHDFASNPISGVHSLFADYLYLPSMTIPTNSNENMTTIQQQSDLIVDYNNAAYVAAAAAATAAALNTLPNATLHNKLLATLPRHTLASAERLLTPVKRRASTVSKTQQQQQQRKRMVESLPHSVMEPPEKAIKKQKNQQHYYGTFQVNANNASPPITTAAAHTNTIAHDYSKTSQQNASTEEKAPQCSNCDATSTPLWRRSVDDKVLCNACGLYLKLHNAPRPKNLKPAHKSKEFRLFGGEDDGDNLTSEAEEAGRAQMLIKCTNCGTNKTPLWRRDVAGQPLCNACGLYYKLHNESRPLSMKTDVIKKRQRAETLNTNTTDAADDQSGKNRYFDQQVENGATLGYRQSASSLPGTGILMMTPNTSP